MQILSYWLYRDGAEMAPVFRSGLYLIAVALSVISELNALSTRLFSHFLLLPEKKSVSDMQKNLYSSLGT